MSSKKKSAKRVDPRKAPSRKASSTNGVHEKDKEKPAPTPVKPSGMVNFRPATLQPRTAATMSLALPGSDPAVDAFSSKAQELLGKARAITVDGEGTLRLATEGLVVIKDALTQSEEKRKFFVKPLNDHTKAINGLFHRITDPLNEADRILRSKVLAYRAEIERAAAAERAQLQDQAVAAADAGDAVTSSALVAQADAVVTPEKTLDAGGLATVGTAKTWVFEVKDPMAVPREYLIVNESKVRQAVKSGIREIPGVLIFEKETLRVGEMLPEFEVQTA